jgi:glutaredoxin
MAAERPVVTLYRREGCHICDEAERELRVLAPGLEFELVCVDIEQDDDLLRRYMFEIPVVTVDGRPLFLAPFSARRLRDGLELALGFR